MKNNFNIHNGLRGKNLLIISHNYNDFIKDQTEIISSNFRHIDVLVRYNPIAEISNLLPIEYLKPYRKKSLLILTNKPENINVITTPVLYLPTDSGYKKLGEKHFKAAEKAIKKNNIKFDLIHAHLTWSAGYVGVKLKEIYKKPVVVTIHENSEWFNKEVNMDYPQINYIWENADALIRVNKKDVPLLKKFNKNVFSIPNGFSSEFKLLDKNECRSKLHLSADINVIFTLGRLIKRKGFNYLISAMKIVTEKRKDVLCFVGGSGPLKDKLQKQINELNLQNHVKLIGFVPDELLPIWMNACDIFVLPSLAEGNPTVMFEALGCGKPFVGTKVGGVPEIITSEDYGLLCEPANPEDLAEKILTALDKEWDVGKIREYAEKYTWENITREILDIYDTLLAER